MIFLIFSNNTNNALILQPFEERASSLTNAADDAFKRRADLFSDTDFPRRRANAAADAFDEAVDKAFDYKGGIVSKGARRPMSVSFDTDQDFADEVSYYNALFLLRPIELLALIQI